MTPRLSTGDRIPQAVLGRLVNGTVEQIALHEFLGAKRAVIVGIPGAFTPVCTHQHIPDLIRKADGLRAGGVEHVICVAPDNPWVVEAWAHDVDPGGKILFLSDRNLMLARAIGVNVVEQERHLGEVSARYLMLTDCGLVRRLSVERRINDLTCTRVDDVVFID